MDVKTKSFYEKAWFAWLMLFMFFPVGLFLLWKYSHHSIWVRSAISFFFAVVFMSSIMSNILHPEKNSAKTDEKKVTVSAQKANETKSTGEVQKENVPDAYFFGFLDFSVDKKSGDLTYLFHNNTSGTIQWVNITGKWLDNNGNIVGEYSGNIRNLASGDKYKVKSIFIPKEATSIRLETLNISEQYVGSGDYKVKKIDLTSIVPVSSLSELKKSSHSYFVTTGFNNKTDAQLRNQSGDSYDKNSYDIAKQIISKDLKAPSTVKWTEVKMMAKDDYHRYIYSVIFEAQNDYGTYLHHEYFVKFRMVSLTDFAYNTIPYVKQNSYRMYSESETLKMLKGEKWNQEPKPGDYF